MVKDKSTTQLGGIDGDILLLRCQEHFEYMKQKKHDEIERESSQLKEQQHKILSNRKNSSGLRATSSERTPTPPPVKNANQTPPPEDQKML